MATTRITMAAVHSSQLPFSCVKFVRNLSGGRNPATMLSGIDRIGQPNALQLTSVKRHPWTNDSHPNPNVERTSGFNNCISDRPCHIQMSKAAQPAKRQQRTDPTQKAVPVKISTSKEAEVKVKPELTQAQIKAAALAKEKIRFGRFQSLRMNLAKM